MAIRLTGISNSGLDTDALVKSLMTAKRSGYNKITQQKTQAEWKKTDYNTMYKGLYEFRNNTVFNFKFTNSLSAKVAASSDEKIATATANANAVNFPHSLTVDKLATNASMSSSAAVTSGGLGISSDTIVKINGIDIPVDDVYTVNDFASVINNTAGLNIKANYDTTLNRFFLYSTKSGADSKIDLSGNVGEAATLLNNLHLNTAAPSVAAGTQGQNAEFTLDGVSSATLGITSNEFTISGVKYNLKGTGGTTSITVSSDNDKVIANVKAFIASYNTMLGAVNAEISETKYKDFLPLTAEQKADMKDSEITAWEAKAKSGMLKNDPTLSTLSYAMRDNFSSAISGLTGSYTTASSIGITTGDYSEKGKLYLDENKLRKALEADPQIVQKMFGTDGDTTSKDGIAVRLYDSLQTAIDKIKVDAGTTDSASGDSTSNLGKKINAYEKTLKDLNARLKEMEESYYKKFSAMETALSKLNSQSSWLAQQLGQSS